MNRFADAAGTEPPLHRADPALEREQVERVKAHRARGSPAGAASALGTLRTDAATDANLMPAIIAAARSGVTVGEMCDALRGSGHRRETPSF